MIIRNTLIIKPGYHVYFLYLHMVANKSCSLSDKWILAQHSSQGKTDGVELAKEWDRFTVYRYVEDWDEDGDTIYETHEYLKDIPEDILKQKIGADTDRQVRSWITANLIKKQSNSLDRIIEFFDGHGVPYVYEAH